ncbi:type I DNA topoisomerase [Desulfoplanes formicivorans]|uniref:DNA topoisomerase 1 n=1 Tax=Desulfoplanes formicivorans TaxID=1592317 RepID=A0A194AGD5_9BACT|nr:type I DNA topoisomerase [Desulfoplanes formicivorans]GAU08388.1 DNA topoisomerase I [Desulfoplanes formicivorans]
MGKDLIIVESPAKVKTIKKFLGKGYAVEASVGHIRDLPTKVLGVDEEHDFAPDYQIIPSKKKVVSTLRAAAKKAETVYLAPDPDREGEAIAWHIAEVIKKQNSNLKRISFNEITARAVKQALASSSELNKHLFDSQQARRILDRIVGYKISPLLWKKVKRGISAGRVQSVALRLIVDREKERQAFKPEEFWVFSVLLEGPTPPPFECQLWKVDGATPQIGSAQQAQALEQAIAQADFSVHKVVEKERKRQPRPPFITSTLQQEASNRLGFSAKRTMMVAQKLYEGVDLGDRGTTALITYMRTDSVRISDEAMETAKSWITQTLGPEYYPDKPRRFKTKGSAQDAHEAIRPVDPLLTPQEVEHFVSREQARLYSLIWERFMASQMAAARFWDTTVTVKAGDTLWRTKGERLIFPGFLKIMHKPASETTAAANIELPRLEQGMALTMRKLNKEQKFTQPPPRFSEASLVRNLEKLGIGRPSTYATIISTLKDREYVAVSQGHFVPTDLGTVVSDLLVTHFAQLMDVDFTAHMEEDLDKVAEGGRDWVALLKDFAKDFYPTLDKATKEMAAIKAGLETDIPCPKCAKPLVIKFGKNGPFLACSAYPSCNFTSNYSRDEKGTIHIETDKDAGKKMGTCPQCGGDLILKKARTGSRFIACSKYPDCRYTQSFSTGVPCPREDCNGELVEKSSRRGKVFYACNQYPKCDYAVWDWPVAETCPDCGSKILVRKTTKSRGLHLACPEKGCKYWRQLEDQAEDQE